MKINKVRFEDTGKEIDLNMSVDLSEECTSNSDYVYELIKALNDKIKGE